MPEMAYKGSQLAKARSRLAVVHRGKRDPQAIEDAYRDLAEAKIASFIMRVLADSPPLTDKQRTQLVKLIRGTQ